VLEVLEYYSRPHLPAVAKEVGISFAETEEEQLGLSKNELSGEEGVKLEGQDRWKG